jgi:hypothetical protein
VITRQAEAVVRTSDVWGLEGVKGVSSNQQFIEATISYYANTDHTWFRFVPGVGITSYIFGHHGSVSEAEHKLVEFHLGR